MACRDTWRWCYSLPFRRCSGFLLRSLTSYPRVVIGFHWRTAVGFSLSPSLCAARLPRCRRCRRHLLGRPTRTCRPHPRSAWSFGGWGSRGAGRSSHLGRDQWSRAERVKPFLKVWTLQCVWCRSGTWCSYVRSVKCKASHQIGFAPWVDHGS